MNVVIVSIGELLLTELHWLHGRAGRYDDIYRMDEIKVYSFIFCSIVYFMVSQNTLFTVIIFHHLDDCDLYTPPRGVKGRQKQVAPSRSTISQDKMMSYS